MLTAAISPILSKVAIFALERISMTIEAGKEVETLQIDLRAIRAVLKDAAKRQIKEEQVRVWLDGLKDSLYDIDSVLDEWTTGIEKFEIAETKQSSIFSCFFVRKSFHRHDIAVKIQDLNRTIATINAAKDRFEFRMTSGSNDYEEPQWPNRTTSFLDTPEVFGQDLHKRVLVDRLTSAEREIQIVPIVGMGGIGKTTLAKHVYNDEGVRAVFGGCRIWICVTGTFDFPRIAGEIIEKLTGKTPTAAARTEVLVESLGESVRDKKFLLVLDDVWTRNYLQDWEPLERALRNGAAGSRVLVTTRDGEVATMVGESYAIRLENLTEQDCWSLMKKIAFSGRNEEDREYLEETGMEIARRCDGLPLAAKTLAGLLRVKASKEEWLRVLNSDLWELENVEENVFRPLLLSYYDLSDLEQFCFSYCAILAKGHEIHKDDLVQQWMSQRYFASSHNDQEEIGRRCFDNLVARSFFQDFEYEDIRNKRVMSCKMHDVVHDFAQFLAKDYFNISEEYSNISVDLIARHVNLTNQFGEEFCITSSSPRRLHTLVISSPPNSFLSNRLSDFECLRTLSLTRDSSFELPSSIGKLIHLRYLCLIASCFQIKLPATIGDLFNLHTLKIVASVTLPEEMENLINLRHLYVTDVTDANGRQSWPKAIGRLRNLKTVERLCPDCKEEAFQLQDLRNLKNLQYIYLKGLGVDQKQVEGAKLAMLCHNPSLVKLVLHFRQVDSKSCKSKIHTNILEALEPHQSLRFLEIVSYPGRVFPSWVISRINLEMLVLKTCLECETLPAFGKLPCLEFLAIYHPTRLKKLGPEFLGIESGDVDSRVSDTLFPKLKVLVLEEAQSLREWVGVRNWDPNGALKIMPCLREMIICGCPKLQSLPDFLETTPLKRLVIEGCQGLEESCKETGTDWSKIRHVPNLQHWDSGEWRQKYIPRAWTGPGYSNKSSRRRTTSY